MAQSSKSYLHFDVNDTCWIITDCGVKDGVVISVEIKVTFLGAEVIHYVRVTGESGQVQVTSTDIFVDSATALADYGTRITS